MTSPRKVVDWEAVEMHYRAGVRSLKDIGKEFGVSDAGIIKKAKGKGWSRDLAAKIKAKADAKVSAAAVSAEVSAERAANEQAVVDANAELQYRIRMEHRQDIQRGRTIFGTLLAEIEHQSAALDLYEKLGELLNEPEITESGRIIPDKLNELYHKVISTPGRVDSAKKLVEMLEKLVRLERQAFNLDDLKPAETDPLTKLLQTISSGNTSSFKPVANDPEHEDEA